MKLPMQEKYDYKKYLCYFSIVAYLTIWLSSCEGKINSELIDSARIFDVTQIQELLKKGGDPNYADSSGKTALHWLCIFAESKPGNSQRIIHLLTGYGANVNLQDHDGNTPLFYAIKSGNYEATESLVNHGARINIKNKYLQTPVFQAVSFIVAGNPEVNSMNYVRLLYEAGADLRVKDKEGKNLIHASRNPEVTAWLIEKGLNPKERDKYRKTPLDYSSSEIFQLRDSIAGFSVSRHKK